MIGSGVGVDAAGSSDDGVWESTGQQVKELRSIYPLPPDAPVLRLDAEALNRVLNGVSDGGDGGADESAVVLTLPMPDGSFARFRLQASPVMAPALAAEYPQIKSYRGRGLDNPLLTMRCNQSPRGFYALVTDGAETVVVHPVYRSGRPSRNDRRDATDEDNGAPRRSGEYVSYSGRDYAMIAAKARCSVTESDIVGNYAALHATRVADRLAANPVNYPAGDHLATYRIAVATTAQYGSDINSVVNRISGVNLIYERELSIHLDLVTDSGLLGSASFSDGDPDSMVDQAKQFLKSKLNDGDYDLGHVLGRGNGGKAYIGAVCSTESDNTGPYKAGGVTLVNGYPGNPVDVVSLAHEIGHQFGAMHSFNANTGNCSQTRFGDSAYESGSGLTIMSLAGACGPNAIAPGREARFHAGSLEEIMTYLSFIGRGTVDGTGNNIPTVNGGADYVIPRNTPFKLTAAGGDADAGDAPNLTYVWEQMDAGGGAYINPEYSDAGDPPNTTRPIFRPFSPSADRSRTFPSLNCILNAANAPPATDGGGFQTAENLPNVTRTMNFRVTVRDNRGTGGGASSDAVRIEVDGDRGPFAVTAPNSSTTWPGGSQQTVTWSVNGAESLAANVKITLSTDGGTTFPHVLAESAPNNGSKEFTVPGLDTQSARIKIAAIGNVFFDISDADFTITAGSSCAYTINPTGQNFAASGGAGAVDVTAGVGCAWTATSNASSWITIVAGASCEGNGTVGYFVAANTGPLRTGMMTIAGQTFTVTQDGTGGTVGLHTIRCHSPCVCSTLDRARAPAMLPAFRSATTRFALSRQRETAAA
jgi:hypothetical protein